MTYIKFKDSKYVHVNTWITCLLLLFFLRPTKNSKFIQNGCIQNLDRKSEIMVWGFDILMKQGKDILTSCQPLNYVSIKINKQIK